MYSHPVSFHVQLRINSTIPVAQRRLIALRNNYPLIMCACQFIYFQAHVKNVHINIDYARYCTLIDLI